MKKKKVLITTIPRENISLAARFCREEVLLDTPEKCFYAADNIEYINGFNMPNYATQFIKENVPSVDILEYPTWDEYKEALKEGYDIVGISFWTYTVEEAIIMANLARGAGVKVVWGGGHGASTPGIEVHFDRLFNSYSEYELKTIIEGEEITRLRHPILLTKYDFHLREIKVGFLFTIRGCRYPCSFCSGPRYYKRLDVTHIEEVERVLDIYLEHEVKHISIVDETFLQNKEHAKKVLSALKKRNLRWNCTSRMDVLSGNIAELKTYGLTNVYIGIESMNELSLQAVKKKETPNQTIAILRELEENNAMAISTYMLCFDQDTSQSIKDDIEKLNSFKSLYSTVFWIATPFPGTDYWDRYKAEGKIIDTNWKHYDVLHLVKKHPTISPEKARELLVYCVKNHCHESNTRKARILRKWEKLEKEQNGKNGKNGTVNQTLTK
jgi:radical SAM superfamily enzyme YgiQ (UPF0313 family)